MFQTKVTATPTRAGTPFLLLAAAAAVAINLAWVGLILYWLYCFVASGLVCLFR